jgi:hypothetical protein
LVHSFDICEKLSYMFSLENLKFHFAWNISDCNLKMQTFKTFGASTVSNLYSIWEKIDWWKKAFSIFFLRRKKKDIPYKLGFDSIILLDPSLHLVRQDLVEERVREKERKRERKREREWSLRKIQKELNIEKTNSMLYFSSHFLFSFLFFLCSFYLTIFHLRTFRSPIIFFHPLPFSEY